VLRLALVTAIVLIGAALINWMRNGSAFHIAKAFPLLGGFELSIYDLAGGVMMLMAAAGAMRLFRKEDR